MRLIVIEAPQNTPGASLGQEYILQTNLKHPVTVVGRQASNGIQLQHPSVSRSHVELVPCPEGLLVRDLNSSNGTFVNNYRIPANQPILVRHNDRVRMGEIVTVLNMQPEPGLPLARPQEPGPWRQERAPGPVIPPMPGPQPRAAMGPVQGAAMVIDPPPGRDRVAVLEPPVMERPAPAPAQNAPVAKDSQPNIDLAVEALAKLVKQAQEQQDASPLATVPASKTPARPAKKVEQLELPPAPATGAGLHSTRKVTNLAFVNDDMYRVMRNTGLVPCLDTPVVLGISSAVRGEGRSVVAMGLSLAIAQQLPVPVVLVEADLTKPTLAADLGIANVGLSEYLRGELPIKELLRPTARPEMAVIVAGDCRGQSLETLRSERLTTLINSLTQHYAAVIIDMPPLEAVGESTRLISQLDHVLMVVSAGKTPTKLIKSSMQIIPTDKLVGTLLNQSKQPCGVFSRVYHKMFG